MKAEGCAPGRAESSSFTIKLAFLCFLFAGMAAMASADTVTAHFTSATDIPVTAPEYTATGNEVDLSLGFTPATGTDLMVVSNTGFELISGEFTNLAQGQVVDLPFNGLIYKYTANYRGGTGNDLVLQWAYQFACAWGTNNYGQLGDAGSLGIQGSAIPVEVNRSGILSGKTVLEVAAGNTWSLALCTDGTLVTWGGNSNVPVEVSKEGALAGKTVKAMSVGSSHILVLCTDGTVVAWGSNYAGQLGDGTTTDRSVPVVINTSGVLSGKTVVAISAGSAYSLVLCADGTVAAWGGNGSGQLGTGDTISSNIPVAVDNSGVLAGKTVTSVAAGLYHSLVLCSDGKMAAWGSGYSGQLGSGATTISYLPVMVDDTGVLAGKSVMAIAAGPNHNLALCDDQTLVGWGSNSGGKLGNNTTVNSNIPVATTTSGVLSGKTVSVLSAGPSSSYALCSDGTLTGWGWYLGNGSATNSPVPVIVSTSGLPPGSKFTKVEAGENHCLAVAALPLSSDSTLSNLRLNPGTLNHDLSPDLSDYIATIPSGTTSLKVIPTVRHPLARVVVNGVTVPSGIESGAIPIVGGSTVIAVTVFAEDGTSTSYSVNVIASTGISAVYHSAAEVPLVCPVFDATGLTANISLGFAPPVGTKLTVIKNTGLAFIAGQFGNLAHGQVISLTYNGLAYRFVANYYGGSGNDLVLEWFRREVGAWGANSGRLGNGTTATSKVPATAVNTGILSGKAVVAVSAGSAHSLALCSDGTVASWGSNTNGQLGNGTLTLSIEPVAVDFGGVLAGKTVIAVAAGGAHSLALCADGTLAAWGSNSYGQLGDGSTVGQKSPVAVDKSGVLSSKTPIALAAGYYHSLVLCSDGTVVSWGDNEDGQLGYGSASYYNRLPVGVSHTGVLSGRLVTAVFAGGYHNLAQCSDGTVVAWGSGDSGQLGNGITADSKTPVAVTTTGVLSSKTVIGLVAGGQHSLALCSDGTLASWGRNDYGQLGDGSGTNRLEPVAVNRSGVLLGKTAVAMAAGGSFSLLLCSDGDIVAWGANGSGQMGNGSTSNSSTRVLVDRSGVLLNKPVTMIAAGASHALVLASTSVSSKLTGLVSSGDLLPAFSPGITSYFARVARGTPTISVKATAPDAVMVKINGVPVESGTLHDVSVQQGMRIPIQVLGDGGDVTVYTITIAVDDFYDIRFDTATDVPFICGDMDFKGATAEFALGFIPSPGTSLTVARNTGLGFISGQFTNLAQGQCVEIPYGGNTYRFVANYYGGSGNDLVLEWAPRSIAAWGRNSASQLGDGGTTNRSLPVAVTDNGAFSGKTVLSVVSGAAHSLVLCSDGTIISWGFDIGSYPNTVSAPHVVSQTGDLAGKRAVAISSANNNALALYSDGTVGAWGSGGMLGNGSTSSTTTPVAVDTSGVLSGKSIVAVASGGTHCLALSSDGKVFSWGYNSSGQLGNNTTTMSSSLPVAVSTTGVLSGKTVVAIMAGLYHSLALCSDGTLACWGSGGYGQLGYGGGGYSSVPVAVYSSGVLSGKKVVALSACSANFCVVLCSDGTLAAWGDNGYGQLGDGTTSTDFVPVLVRATGALSGKTVVSITSGFGHTLATCSDGTAVTWGYNEFGQLGNGTTINSNVPVKVSSTGLPFGKKALSGTAAYHSLVILAEANSSLPTNGYTTWITPQSGVSNKAETADPDSDGIPNLMEYVLHGNPAVSSESILPVLSPDGNNIVFNFSRFASSDQDTTQLFQFSSDMIHWASLAVTSPSGGGVTLGDVDGGGNQPVTVTIPKGQNTRLFGRLKVTRP